jgi:hypothetical protein
MLWRKTRDVVVETYTLVKKVDTDFGKHEKKQDKQVGELHKLIKDCKVSCPEKDNFLRYTSTQNGTLLRMEKKYDNFFREHNALITKTESKLSRKVLDTNLEVAMVKESVNDIKKSKKCRKEIIAEWLKYIAITCVLIGTLVGVLRYQESVKKVQTVNIEKMLEQILRK